MSALIITTITLACVAFVAVPSYLLWQKKLSAKESPENSNVEMLKRSETLNPVCGLDLSGVSAVREDEQSPWEGMRSASIVEQEKV